MYREIMTNYPASWTNSYAPLEHAYDRWSRAAYLRETPVTSVTKFQGKADKPDRDDGPMKRCSPI